jgi:protein OS-9
MTDTILFIKETTTCHYVLVIQTPRLCGEPMFRSRLEAREESTIRCREIVQGFDQLDRTDEQNTLIESSVPLHVQRPTETSTSSTKQDSQHRERAPPTIDKKLISGILSQLREKGLGNMFSFMDGGLLLEDVGDDGTVLMAYEVDLDAVDSIEGLTKGKQYRLTEDVVNTLWTSDESHVGIEDESHQGENEAEDDHIAGDKEPRHATDEL